MARPNPPLRKTHPPAFPETPSSSSLIAQGGWGGLIAMEKALGRLRLLRYGRAGTSAVPPLPMIISAIEMLVMARSGGFH